MSPLKLFVFGPPRLERDDQAIEISLRKARALLVYLAVTRKPHSRDTLATLFWPESDQSSGRASLRRTLYRLNQTLADDILRATAEMIDLNPESDIWLDVEAYREHLIACLPANSPTNQPTTHLAPQCIHRLAEAVALYTDDFLAGFNLPGSPEFDEWQFFQREELRQSLAQVLVQLIHVRRVQADFEQAIVYGRRWLALDPLHEPAQRQLMQLYAWSGQQAAALRQYEECARLLKEELGIEPEAKTTALYETIKARQLAPPAGAQGSRSAGVQRSGGAGKIDADVLETAAPGEILLPRTVMDLVVGAGFDFVDRGLRPLPGIAADWRLFALK